MSQTIREIMSDEIDDPVNAMRSSLDIQGLHDLAADIKRNGLINPITVRPKEGRFEVVAGHRRFSACKIAGVIRIQCVVRELTDEQVFQIMTSENLAREEVNLLDECNHYRRCKDVLGKSEKEIADSIGRSVGYVKDRLTIAEMPDYMKEYIQSGQLKLGVALALFEITTDHIRQMWVEYAVRDGVSVAQAEYWVHGWRVNQLPGGTLSETPPEGFVPGATPVVQFECAVDGKKYDARLFKTLMVYEGNLEFLNDVISEIRRQPAPISAPPAES